MSKIFQVRYTVGDKTVAHEHYTEKGGRADAKALSKVIGNAVMGEIDIDDEGAQAMVRTWEFTGGEMGKAIKREGAPSEVEVVKTADDTRLAEGKVEKKPKAPKLTDEEKIAKIKADAEEKLAQIAAGTYVIPVRGRKASGDGTTVARKRTEAPDRVEKLVKELGLSERAAQIIAGAQLNATGRRMRVTVAVINADGPILASQIAADLNATGKEDREVVIDDIIAAVQHTNYLFVRENQPYRITVKPVGEQDQKLNLVSVRMEIEGDEDEEAVEPNAVGDEAAA
jgi:hypothetical protein